MSDPIVPTPPIAEAELRRMAAAREKLTAVVAVRLGDLVQNGEHFSLDEIVEAYVLGDAEDLGLSFDSRRVVGHVPGSPGDYRGGSMLLEIVAAVLDYSDLEEDDHHGG